MTLIEDRSGNESGQVLNLLPKENDVEVCCLLTQVRMEGNAYYDEIHRGRIYEYI